MPAGVYRTLSCAFYGYTEVCYIHIGVGFNVAYLLRWAMRRPEVWDK